MWAMTAISRDLRVVNVGIFAGFVGRHRRQLEEALDRGRASGWRSVGRQWLTFLGVRRVQELVCPFRPTITCIHQDFDFRSGYDHVERASPLAKGKFGTTALRAAILLPPL